MKRRKGFTLIEVLVVVTIIALLIAILVPSVRRAREMSRRTACQANLRNISQATELYVHDHRWYPEINDPNSAALRWVGTVCYDFVSSGTLITDRPNRPLNKYLQIKPVVWRTPGERPPVPDVFVASRCPSDEDDYPAQGNSYCFNYSHFKPSDGSGTGWYSLRHCRMEHVKHNLTRVVLAGDRPMNWAVGFLSGYGEAKPGRYAGPHDRGLSWGNACFLDGHVQYLEFGDTPETSVSRDGKYTIDIKCATYEQLEKAREEEARFR